MDVKCCRHQHEVLVAYIRYALRCWGPLYDPLLSYWIDDTVRPWIYRYSPIQATPELKRVLTRARILSEDCCTELPLLKAILQHANRSQEFADIVKEIQWCTSVVYNGTICRNVTRKSALEFKDFPWQAKIGYQEKIFLERAEQEDWEQLMQQLRKYDGYRQCNVEDCGDMHARIDPSYCLARQAMRRFLLQENQRFFPQESSRSEHDHKSMLWSFDPEVVKHGRLLGSGAFGAVTEVTWLGFKYAQKTFNASGLHSLLAEAEALTKLNHPHIVKVYANSEDSLLMDLMYTDLHKFMKSRMKGGARVQPFSLPAAMDMMLQIADAVSYLHSQKVAHRDLKSPNILVNPVNTLGLDEDDGFVFVKIADFGVAKTKREVTRYSHLTHNVGTRRWMAPEIFGANIDDDHLEHAFPMKSDVYSFGIICFEILTGQEPFRDEPLSTLYSKLTAPFPLRPQLPSSCPTNLASLICACWDSDPQERPAFGDVCRVLRYLKGLPTLIVLSDPQRIQIDAEWPFGRLPAIVKTQGPWGDLHILENEYCETVTSLVNDSPVNDIRGVKFIFDDCKLRQLLGFKIVFFHKGLRMETHIGAIDADIGRNNDWIYFQENEFIVQVEASISQSHGVVSLNFITTRQKYKSSTVSRFIVKDKLESFCSHRGRVVGFTGFSKSAYKLFTLEVHTVPNIVECLREYLGNEESID